MQLYRYLTENHQKLSLYELCGHVEKLHLAKLTDVIIGSILKAKLISSLHDIDSPMVMGRVLYLLNKCPSMDDEFFVMITNHIYNKGIYPSGDVPRLWCRYFKFIGDSRLYHRGLLEVLCGGFSEYLQAYLDRPAGLHPRRMQESVAIAAWALAISAPNVACDSVFERMLALTCMSGIERSVLIRIYWSMAIRKWRMDKLDLCLLDRLFNDTMCDSSVGLRRKSHIHQIYTVLRCLKLCGIDDLKLLDRCLEALHALKYGQNDSKISTSQRYVSDVLVRLGIPHKLELLTPDLLSIDIAIEGQGERIALEVDGPLHFTRICDGSATSTPMKTGPTQIKQDFLKSSGWSFLSVPPVKLDDSVDLSAAIGSIDAYYKRLLLESGSPYLRRLLDSQQHIITSSNV
ncbi:hypothetical protein X943_002831 [Babesia divergens]|uniref:RAP domain-containing protein n=1 Tax=Babesia divergens TaxID=32595 RepID=A0AAD9G7L2_BABDI|nr:hypothetical protein X943_002831 [Babesia divergens]